MAKKSLLLVDADPRSLRVLEVSLRKAGYSVATCRDAPNALETVDLSQPDLILSDTRLPGTNGFELVEELRQHDEHKTIPFMFLSSDSSVESKVRGLELGVEDYLVKPIYIKEIITRINLTLQRQEREGLQRRTSISKTRFTGSLADMGLVDLFQTVEISRKSGVLELTNGAERGSVTFREGQLVDAELGKLRAEAAIYRLLLWNEGEFEIDFRPVRAEQRITSSTQALLMEGMRRIDEWGRLLEQIPSLDNVFEVSDDELVERLAEIPDEINEILRQIDGRRSLMQVVDACEGEDLETLTAITKLYFEGIIYPTGRTADAADEGLDEELVPGEAGLDAPVGLVPGEQDEPDDDAPSLVPRTPTEPPPSQAAQSRAKPNADVHESAQDVPERAGGAVPPSPDVEGERGERASGMDAAHEGAAGERVGVLDAGAPQDDPHYSEPEAPDEDGMTKKGRRRRKMRVKAAQAAESLESQEASNNVIQFPAQAKRTVTSSSVAVNDDVGVATVDETVDEPASVTAPRREEALAEAKASEREPEPEAKAAAEPEAKAAAEPEAKAAAEPEAKAAAEPEAKAAAEPEAKAAAEPEAKAAVEPEAKAAVEPEARAAAEPEAKAAAEPEAKAAAEPEAKAAAEPEAQPVSMPEGEPKPAEEAKAEAAEPAPESRPGGKKRKKRKGQRSSIPPKAAQLDAKAAEAKDEPKPAESKPEPKADSKPAAQSEPPETGAASEPDKRSSTTSQEIAAVTATGAHQAIAEDFFRSSDAVQASGAQGESWDDLEKDILPMSAGMKRAKQATLAIGGIGLIVIGAFLVYHKVIMPTGVELSGATRPPEMPEGFAAERIEPSEPSEPEEAPAATQRAAVEAPAPEAEAVEEAAEPATEAAEAAAVAVVEEPAAAEPAAAEPAAAEPAAAEPAAPEPEAASPAAAEDAADLARQAMGALNRGRNDDAAGLAQRSVSADPTNALAWLVLGAARQANRDAEGARAAYQSCVDQGVQQQYVRECRALLR